MKPLTVMTAALLDYLRSIRRALVRASRMPPVGGIDLGDLDRLTPISKDWGFDRGIPVDRHYIEEFLNEFAKDVRGSVLEVANNEYTIRFGGDRVVRSDVLHDSPGNPRATVIADLSTPSDVMTEQFDCVICTQTIHLIYSVQSAISSLNRFLKPGGVLLLTVPTITAISREDMNRHGDYWRFTTAAVKKLLGSEFGERNLTIRTYGNVYAAISFLHGLSVEDIDSSKLEFFDPDYEMLIGARVVKDQPSR